MAEGGLLIVNSGNGASPAAVVGGSHPPAASKEAAFDGEKASEVIVKDGDPLPPPEAIPPKGLDTLPPELLKARITIIAALKSAGYTRPQIARALKLSPSAVAYSLRVARQRKLLASGMEEAVRELEDEAVPLAVEGLLKHLRRGDKEAVFETLKGRGLFRNHNVRDNEEGGQALPQLQINILNAPAVQAEKPIGVLGVPRSEND